MPIYTVLGPIDPVDLGPTSMHEHVLLDIAFQFSPAREPEPDDKRVTIENLGFVRWNYESLEDNLRLDDSELAAREISALAHVAGAAIVDQTTVGIRTFPAKLPAISRNAGVHIVAGAGIYYHASHPDWVEDASVDDLTEFIVSELRNGIADTGIRAGIIGEIGTGDPPTEREIKVLHASARASELTGAAINVHTSAFGHHALTIIEILLSEGMAADRMIMSHMDSCGSLDRGYHRAVADTGAILEFDTFGAECYASGAPFLVRNSTDLQRIEHLVPLLEEGRAAQIVLGTDVYTKAQLRSYGGSGYDHLIKRIVPALRDHFGVSDETIEQMLVDNPRRLLDRPAPEA
jgi:phosphotriesterase-related protein